MAIGDIVRGRGGSRRLSLGITSIPRDRGTEARRMVGWKAASRSGSEGSGRSCHTGGPVHSVFQPVAGDEGPAAPAQKS